MKIIIRIITLAGSLKILLKGQLSFMNKYYEIIGVSSSVKDLVEFEYTEGVRTIEVNMTRAITPIKALASVYQLYKIFKKVKPLIVHTHTPKSGPVGVPHRLTYNTDLPLLEASGSKRKLLNLVEKITYKCATMILPNSFGI